MMMLLLAGCFPCTGELDVIDGDLPLSTGESASFQLIWSGDRIEPCEVSWFVDEIEGGSAEVGQITDCGVYTAPEQPPDADPRITGAEFAPGTCADCCMGASRTISVQ